jgi:hypothetical protein
MRDAIKPVSRTATRIGSIARRYGGRDEYRSERRRYGGGEDYRYERRSAPMRSAAGRGTDARVGSHRLGRRARFVYRSPERGRMPAA